MSIRNGKNASNSCPYEIYRLSTCWRSEIRSEKTIEFGGQVLHAGTLGFNHPTTGEYMEFTSPPPEDFQALVEKVRKGVDKTEE